MSIDNKGGKWVFDEEGNAHYVEGGNSVRSTSQSSTEGRKNTDNSGWHWLLILGALMVFPPLGVILLILQLMGKWTDEAAASGAKRVGRAIRQVTEESRENAAARNEAVAEKRAKREMALEQEKQKKKKKARSDGSVFGLGNIKLLRGIGIALASIFGFSGIMSLIDEIHYFTGIWDLVGDLIPQIAFFIVGIALIGIAHSRDNKLSNFKKYLSMIGNQKAVSVSSLASAMGTTNTKVFEDLDEMLERGVFEEGYVDRAHGMLILEGNLSQDAYQKELEKQKQKKAEEAQVEGDPLAEDMLRQIKAANDAIENEELSRKIDRIGELTAKIFRLLKEKPEKASELRTFMNYYLPQTLKILESYSRMEAQGVEGENISEAKQRIEDVMDKLVDGYEAQLDKLFADDVLDITADLQVMENMLEKDGLLVEEDFHF